MIGERTRMAVWSKRKESVDCQLKPNVAVSEAIGSTNKQREDSSLIDVSLKVNCGYLSVSTIGDTTNAQAANTSTDGN